METGLSNLAFPRLNLSSMRSCEREEVDLERRGQKAEMKMNNVTIRNREHFSSGRNRHRIRGINKKCTEKSFFPTL